MKYLSSLSQETTDAAIAVVNDFIQKWHTKDAEKFGTIFTADAEFTDIVNQIARGRQEIIAQHRFPFATVNKVAEFKISQVYMRQIDENLILVTGDWTLEKAQTPKGDPLPDRSGVIQMMLKKEAENWKISLVHNTDLTKIYQNMVNTE